MFLVILAQTGLAGAALIALIADLKQNRRSAERQLRAYVTVEPKGVFATDETGYVRLPIFIKNCGQTPAYSVSVTSAFTYHIIPWSFDPGEVGGIILRDEPSLLTFGPGEGNHVYAAMPNRPTDEQLREISEKKLAIIHFGVVRYRDAFETWQETQFAFYHWGEELSDVESKRCHLWNDAT